MKFETHMEKFNSIKITTWNTFIRDSRRKCTKVLGRHQLPVYQSKNTVPEKYDPGAPRVDTIQYNIDSRIVPTYLCALGVEVVEIETLI